MLATAPPRTRETHWFGATGRPASASPVPGGPPTRVGSLGVEGMMAVTTQEAVGGDGDPALGQRRDAEGRVVAWPHRAHGGLEEPSARAAHGPPPEHRG